MKKQIDMITIVAWLCAMGTIGTIVGAVYVAGYCLTSYFIGGACGF